MENVQLIYAAEFDHEQTCRSLSGRDFRAHTTLAVSMIRFVQIPFSMQMSVVVGLGWFFKHCRNLLFSASKIFKEPIGYFGVEGDGKKSCRTTRSWRRCEYE